MFQEVELTDDWGDKVFVGVTHDNKFVTLGTAGDCLILTPDQSKRIRKALKRAEQYVEENSDVRSR